MEFPHPMNSRLVALLSRHAAVLGDEGFEIYNAFATGQVEVIATRKTPVDGGERHG